MGVRGVLEPIEGQLETALTGHWRPASIDIGDTGGRFWALDGDRVVLSPGFLVDAPAHPDEPRTGAPALDRWRRALASIVEASVAHELADATGVTPDVGAWWWAGAAAWEADRRAAGLGLAVPDLAIAWAAGDLTACPRGGAAVLAAWAASGRDPLLAATAAIQGDRPDAEAFLALSTWMAAPDGLLAAIGAPVARRPAVDVPFELGPWSFARVEVPAHKRGGFVAVSGPGAISAPWALGGERLEGVAAAAAGAASFTPNAGGPLGTWTVRSSAGFGQVFGSRGMDFRFKASGGFEVLLADAFVGPVHAIEMSERYGTTGTATGTWQVAGARRVRLGPIQTQGVTVHERSGRGTKLPSEPFGIAPMLRGMEGSEWAWSIDGDHLRLVGRMMGGEVEIRLERAP